MLPQHGGVPGFSLKLKGPTLALLILVLLSGGLLTLSFYLDTDSGDIVAERRTTLSLIITLLLTFFILIVGTGRWWHSHLWQQRNSQQSHRYRQKRHRGHHRKHRRKHSRR